MKPHIRKTNGVWRVYRRIGDGSVFWHLEFKYVALFAKTLWTGWKS